MADSITVDDVREFCAGLIAEGAVLDVKESTTIGGYQPETPVKGKPHFKIEIAPSAVSGAVIDRLNKIASANGFTFSLFQGGSLVA